MARVLIFTPTYDNLLQPETVESVMALRFEGERDWVVRDENPYPGRDMRNVVEQFRAGWRLAIEGGYDAILLVEHDMVVPEDALQKLWETPAGVVYGTYELRHGMNVVNLFQHTGGRNLGMSLSLYPRELQAMRKRGWGEVSGAGFGCLLVRREVFSRIGIKDEGNAPDLPFAADCIRQGIRQIGRTDVQCGHIDTDRHVTLWPFEGGSGMIARVIALQNVTVADNGQPVALTQGRYYSLSVASAREMQRAGYVQITNEADVVSDELAEVERATSPRAEERETATAPTVRKRKPRKPKGAA